MPGFEDRVWQTGAIIAGQTQLPSPISKGDPPLSGPRFKAEEEPSGRDSRPFPRAFLQVHGHIRDTYPAQGDDKSLVFRHVCERVRG